jgi:hypothetical protein
VILSIHNIRFIFSALTVILLIFSSCRKDIVDTDPDLKLEFSADTVYFDTIFVSMGSVTRRLKVYNPSDKKIVVSNIKLAGGASSTFRLNVDGISAKEHNDVEIEGKDSVYIFVQVTIDPNNDLLPFVIQDSIEFVTNGNVQDVDLIAWGQNARFYRPNTQIQGLPPFYALTENTTWTNELPVVIFGYLVVDSGATLTIDAGVNVHLYNNSGIWVYKQGALIVNGTQQDSVTFQGVRKEESYIERPGQWDRIWINQGSANNKISHAVIKNGFIGLQAENVTAFGEAPPGQLLIENTRIRNMSGFGIFGADYTIRGNNLLVTNCGSYAVALVRGGNYNFRHCTFANYWSGNVRSTPSVFFNNYENSQGGNLIPKPLTQCYFGNCIIYGNKSDGSEIEYDFANGVAFNFKFDHCLLRITNDFFINDPDRFSNNINNQDPLFADIDEQNFRLKAASPAINTGNIIITNQAPALSFDLKGNNRTIDGQPDLGAFEFVP